VSLLDDLRVVDITGHLAEAAGRVFADLGAEVIKVEPPDGCESRVRGEVDDDGVAWHWRHWGRGKRSVVLDLEATADRARFDCLLGGADVLLESATAAERRRWGIDSAEVARRYPSLVHVSVTPFGLTGPLADAPATDMTLAASGGFLNHQGDKDRPPIPIGFPESANHGAVQAAADALIALFERDRSGLGQHLDTSMQAAVVGTLLWTSSYAVIDKNPGFTADDRAQGSTDRGGEVVPGVRNPVVEPCADGYFVVSYVLGAQGNNAFAASMRWCEEEGALDADLCGRKWEGWIDEMNNGDLAVSDGARAMTQLLAFLKSKTKNELHRRSVRDKLLIAPCNDSIDLLADPQLAAREFWVDIDGFPMPGPFAVLGDTPIVYDRGAPGLGEHQALLDDLDRNPTAPTPTAEPRRSAFAGLRVADLTWMAAGPLITRELANHGATVVHAETMTRVDTMRWLPPYFNETFTPETGLPAANANQSKYGLACNFSIPEARAIVDRLIDWADVVVENFRPGMAARNGFGWEYVHDRNPKVLMLSTSMRGQTGPESTYAGFGLQGAALAGFCDITGWPDRAPIAPWGAYTDFISPRYALAALVAALRERARSGIGQYIDISQNECGVHFLGPLILQTAATGKTLMRPGSAAEQGAPSGVFRVGKTQRFLVVSAVTDLHWNGVRSVVPAMEHFAAFDTDAVGRLQRRAEIETVFIGWLAERDVFEAQELLMNAGCPAYVSLRATDLNRDPQLKHRSFFTPLSHPVIDARFDGPVSHFSVTPAAPWRAGPTIGQDNEYVLKELLGFTDDEITRLAIAEALT
jgi:crotonobetainyl-CoA:carnitine CoA-transferase CaiB-like acyl-CoA transferase